MQTNIGFLSTIGGETQVDQNKAMISLSTIKQKQFKQKYKSGNVSVL